MSAKARVFALAVSAAALALSVPAAHAATVAGPSSSGGNNDSLVNVSGNQVPIQLCNNDIPVNGGFLVGQVPLADISALLGLVNTGNSTSVDDRSCTQVPTQVDPSSTDTSATSAAPAAVTGDDHGDPASSGGNNDSLVNASDNQVPLQGCNNDIPVNGGVGAVQVPAEDLSGALGLLNSGSSSSTDARNCVSVPTQVNPNSTTTSSSSS